MNIKIIERASKIIAKAVAEVKEELPDFFSINEFHYRIGKKNAPYTSQLLSKLKQELVIEIGTVKKQCEGTPSYPETFTVKTKVFQLKPNAKAPTEEEIKDMMFDVFRGQINWPCQPVSLSEIPIEILTEEIKKRLTPVNEKEKRFMI